MGIRFGRVFADTGLGNQGMMRKTSITALALLGLFALTTTPVQAQWFESIVKKETDQQPSTTTTGNSAGNSMGGILAAPPPTAASPNYPVQQNRMDFGTGPQTKPKPVPSTYTADPKARKLEPVTSGVALGQRAILDKYKRKGALIHPAFADHLKTLKMPSGVDIGLPRHDGMLQKERATKRRIEKLMKVVTAKGLPPLQRQAEAQRAYDLLLEKYDRILATEHIPDEMFKRMGVSDAYIRDRREGRDKSRERLREAIRYLDTIR